MNPMEEAAKTIAAIAMTRYNQRKLMEMTYLEYSRQYCNAARFSIEISFKFKDACFVVGRSMFPEIQINAATSFELIM